MQSEAAISTHIRHRPLALSQGSCQFHKRRHDTNHESAHPPAHTTDAQTDQHTSTSARNSTHQNPTTSMHTHADLHTITHRLYDPRQTQPQANIFAVVSRQAQPAMRIHTDSGTDTARHPQSRERPWGRIRVRSPMCPEQCAADFIVFRALARCTGTGVGRGYLPKRRRQATPHRGRA